MSSHHFAKISHDNVGQKEWMYIHCVELKADNIECETLDVSGANPKAIGQINNRVTNQFILTAGEVNAVDLDNAVDDFKDGGMLRPSVNELEVPKTGLYRIDCWMDRFVFSTEADKDSFRAFRVYPYINDVIDNSVNLFDASYQKHKDYDSVTMTSITNGSTGFRLINLNAGDKVSFKLYLSSGPDFNGIFKWNIVLTEA